MDNDLDKKFEADRVYKILKENFIDIDTTKELQYIFIVLFIKKDERKAFEELYNTTNESDKKRGVENLQKLGILNDWIRITYTPSLKEKYPESYNFV